VAVAREITKPHEEVWTGILGEATEHWSEPTRGEVTVVLGPIAPPGSDVELGLKLARELVEQGRSVSDAAREASAGTDVPRRLLYQALLDDQRLRGISEADA
jgi:16S rRNA (cytidine1402-2'-O)-methyltransferase